MGQCRTESVIRVVTLVVMITRFSISLMNTFFRSARILPFLVLVILLSSCEKDREGTIDSNTKQPLIESATLQFAQVNLDSTMEGGLLRLPDGTYRITDTLSAVARYEAGNLKAVYYRVYRPGSSGYFASGALALDSTISSEAAAFSARVSFALDRSDAGLYRVEVFAQSRSGISSTSILIPLLVTRNNSAPRILSAEVPDTVNLPPGGRLLLKFTLAVSDSDGLGDIAGAFFYSLSSSRPEDRIVLADDGNVTGISGDELAGDGIYTITVELIDGPSVRKTFDFEFHAVDLQGADSGPLHKFLTVN